MNSIFSITVEKNNGVWAFTDKSRDLSNEPFVSGADLILDKLCIEISAPFMKLNLIFADFPFPDHMFSFSKKLSESGGWWYSSVDFDIDGWLCPAMFKYFKEAPYNIYLKVLPAI